MRENKWLICLIFAICCALNIGTAMAQHKAVTLALKNVSIETALNEVKRQSGVNILYNAGLFEGASPVSVNVKNVDYETVLKQILNNRGFGYVLKNGFVVIRSQQQSYQIKGTVVDTNGDPIPGATLVSERHTHRYLIEH